MALANRDFTLDNEDIQQSRQDGTLPSELPKEEQAEDILLQEVTHKIADEVYSVNELNISKPMKRRLEGLGLSNLKRLQKETVVSLMAYGLTQWDGRDIRAAMNEIGMPMPKAERGQLRDTLRPAKPKKTVKVVATGTPLDSLDVSKGIRRRLREAGLKRLDTIQKCTTDSMIALGLSRWDAQIVSAAMSRLGLPIQRNEEGSLFHTTPQKLNRTMPKRKLKVHWTQTPEGKEKMAGIRAKAIQARKKKAKEKNNGSYPKKYGPSYPFHLLFRNDTPNLTPQMKIDMMKQFNKAGIITLSQLLELSGTQLGTIVGSLQARKLVDFLAEKKIYKKDAMKMKLEQEHHQEEPITVIPIPKPTGEEEHGNKNDEHYIGYIIGYAHSDILQRISVLSESTGGKISEAELALRLGRLLQGEKMR